MESKLKDNFHTDMIDVASELQKFNKSTQIFDLEENVSDSTGVGYDDLAALYDVSQAVNSTLILDDILDIVMTRSIKLFNTDRGFLMLLDNQGKLQFKTAHNIKMEQLDSEDMKISSTIADLVVKTGKSLYTSDAQKDERFAGKSSIIDLNIRSAMCVPLTIKDSTIGCLYLDNSTQGKIFLKQDLVLFEMFAAQAALAIHNARLYSEVLESQKFQQNIVSNVPIGLLVIDTEGEIVEVNDAISSIFEKVGWTNVEPTRDSLRGLKLNDVLPKQHYSLMQDSLVKALSKPVEISRLNIDYKSNEVILKIKVCPFDNFQGQRAGYLLLFEDVTEQVILEQYLILSEKLIAKGEMAAAIGHELNNYLTAISTNAQLLSMLMNQGRTEKLQDKVKVIIENVDHIKRFSDGLMDFSALESKIVPYDLRQLLEDLVFFVHPQKAFKQVKFEIDLPADLPQALIDVGQIHQVLLNLMINASDEFKRTSDGVGVISVTAIHDQDKNNITVSITDDGPGIDEDILPKIFKPHVTSKESGHGLGLWTCQRIVDKHNGTLKAENVAGAGARFTLTLPAAHAE